jgi:ABC-type transport system involved in cytochrome bd biosynthesis fused ATPase/permease subunit
MPTPKRGTMRNPIIAGVIIAAIVAAIAVFGVVDVFLVILFIFCALVAIGGFWIAVNNSTDPHSIELRAANRRAHESRQVATTDTTAQRASKSGQQVVEYRSAEAFQLDRTKWLTSGWRIVTVSDSPQRPGVARFATLGVIGAVVVKPKSHVFVVYERAPD